MTEPIDVLGPVDYLVNEFPSSRFNGEIGSFAAAPETS